MKFLEILIEFETTVFVDVYRDMWTPVKDETLLFMEDKREEAKSFDKYCILIFQNHVLVGHVSIELLRLIYYFLKSDSPAIIFAKVKGKRKRGIGLIVPALYMAQQIRAVLLHSQQMVF